MQFYNEHIQPIIRHRWEKLNTPLHMAAYALNPRWYGQRPSKIIPVEDLEVKDRFIDAVDKLYVPTEASQIPTEWTKFATL